MMRTSRRVEKKESHSLHVTRMIFERGRSAESLLFPSLSAGNGGVGFRCAGRGTDSLTKRSIYRSPSVLVHISIDCIFLSCPARSMLVQDLSAKKFPTTATELYVFLSGLVYPSPSFHFQCHIVHPPQINHNLIHFMDSGTINSQSDEQIEIGLVSSTGLFVATSHFVISVVAFLAFVFTRIHAF